MSARARAAARALLRHYDLRYPPVPESILAEWDPPLHVRLAPLHGASGALYRELAGAVIWLEEAEPETRRRFTLFHEVAHLLLHPKVFYCRVGTRREATMEREADAFSAEVLMPREWLYADAPTEPGDPGRLAQLYGVSREAMGIRLRELGLE